MRSKVFLLCKEWGKEERPAGFWQYVEDGNHHHVIAFLSFKQAFKVQDRAGDMWDSTWIN